MNKRKKRIPGVTGRKGNTVSYMLNGELVERTIGISNKAATEDQKAGRKEMAAVVNFLKPVKEFIEIGFILEKKNPHDNAHNLARSYLKLNAINRDEENPKIDFDLVLFSQGNMPVNSEATVRAVEGGLQFSWNPTLLLDGMSANDQVMMLAYCPEKESAFFQTAGTRRSVGTDFLEVASYHQPVILEVYLSFVSADRKSISKSVHIGQLIFHKSLI